MELKEALEGIRHSEPGRSHAVGDQGQEMPVFERIITRGVRYAMQTLNLKTDNCPERYLDAKVRFFQKSDVEL